MRLTLRTMLAYLDEILDPEDAQDIGRKITESEFASNLIHRTQNCVRRQRLGAPSVLGRGIAYDPNSVAEYLDNTLAADRVAEFEKVCLESDVHLAEVASCHQILTLVLGEPANIDPNTREKMYQLQLRADRPVPPTLRSATPPQVHVERTPMPSDTPAVPPSLHRQRPQVPDYLRESAKARRRPMIRIIAATAVITLLTLALMGSPELRKRMGIQGASAPLAGNPTAVPTVDPGQKLAPTHSAPETNDPKQEQGPSPVTPLAPAADKREEKASSVRSSQGGDGAGPSDPVVNAPSSLGSKDPQEVISPVKDPATTPDTSNNSKATAAPIVSPDPAASNPAVTTSTGASPAGTDATGAPHAVVSTSENPTAVTDSAASTKPAESDPAAPPEEPKKKVEPTTDTQEMGQYLSDAQLLLGWDFQKKTWHRLPTKWMIHAGDRVLSLPAFHPAIALTNGITIEAVGPSVFQLQGRNAEGSPIIDLDFGRLKFFATGKTGAHIELKVQGRPIVVSFDAADSALVLDAQKILMIGADPEAEPADTNVDLYAVHGKFKWSEAGGEHDLNAPEHVNLKTPNASTAGDFPEWIESDSVNALEVRAVPVLEREISPDSPWELSIKELANNHRQKEVRSLAIRCAGYAGIFEPLVDSLKDEDQRVWWPSHIESLKSAIARSPETAAQIRGVLEQSSGAQGKALFRMLWGYTAQQLKAGDDRVLVDGLSSEQLEVRVLSFWNLQQITGTGQGSLYRPEDSAAKRKQHIRNWKDKLAKGKIVPTPREATPKRANGAS